MALAPDERTMKCRIKTWTRRPGGQSFTSGRIGPPCIRTKSPRAVTFFLNHLQEKKPGLLNFDAADKCQIIQDWLRRDGRIAN
jgi:hypothetical protein